MVGQVANLLPNGGFDLGDRSGRRRPERGKSASPESRQRLRCRAAGVPLLTGTDTGFAVTPYGEWNARELELFVEDLGFTPAAALRAATEVNARFMTEGARIGALEPGRAADFIVLDASPLNDIRVLQDSERLQAVYIAVLLTAAWANFTTKDVTS